MLKKILIFLIVSFVVGNAIAWISGAGPIEFKPVPLNTGETLLEKEYLSSLKINADDKESLIFLGSLYSNHNQIDKAYQLLSKAYQLYPDDPLVQAFYFSNESKRAGAMLDLTMGIYKLMWLQEAIDGLNRSVALDETNLLVRINRLITFGYLGSINDDFDKVFEDEQWVISRVEKSEAAMPNDVYQHLYSSLANAYWEKSENSEVQGKYVDKSKYYLSQLSSLGGCPESALEQCQTLMKKVQ